MTPQFDPSFKCRSCDGSGIVKLLTGEKPCLDCVGTGRQLDAQHLEEVRREREAVVAVINHGQSLVFTYGAESGIPTIRTWPANEVVKESSALIADNQVPSCLGQWPWLSESVRHEAFAKNAAKAQEIADFILKQADESHKRDLLLGFLRGQYTLGAMEWQSKP